MAPIMSVALLHSGVCRTIPKVIVYAPLQYQGLNVPDIYVKQGFSKLVRLLKFGRPSHAITLNLLRHSGEAMKMEFGLNGYLLQHNFHNYQGIITPSWMKEVWRFVSEHDICVEDDLPGFTIRRQHDRLLMEVFTALRLSRSDLHKVNVCRLHLQALTIADITDGCGDRLTWNAWQEKRAVPHTYQYKWGIQPSPPVSFWAVWQRALSMLCARDRRLLQPLGHWTGEGCQHWIWWYDECTDSLFKRTKEDTICYLDRSACNTRRANWWFNELSFAPADIPSSATPCTVVQQGQFLLFQGTAPTSAWIVNSRPLSFQTFPAYLSSLASQRWVFDVVQMCRSMEHLAQSIRAGTCLCITDAVRLNTDRLCAQTD
jgi:hypothetical protein